MNADPLMTDWNGPANEDYFRERSRRLAAATVPDPLPASRGLAPRTWHDVQSGTDSHADAERQQQREAASAEASGRSGRSTPPAGRADAPGISAAKGVPAPDPSRAGDGTSEPPAATSRARARVSVGIGLGAIPFS